MFSEIKSAGLFGLNAFMVTVQASIAPGQPSFDIVGMPDIAVQESKARIRAVLGHLELKLLNGKVTVNLAPADTRKAGTLYDLPVLLGILCATGEIRQPPATAAFFGEVSLAGEIRPVTGALTMALAAEQIGLRELFVPAGNAAEAAFADLRHFVVLYGVVVIAVLLAAVVFGPGAGFAVGAVADIIGSVLAGYAINPLITLGAGAIGLVAGLAWQKLPGLRTGLRLQISVLLGHFVGSVVITSLALRIFYGYPWATLAVRIPNALILSAVNVVLLRILLENRSLMKLAKK